MTLTKSYLFLYNVVQLIANLCTVASIVRFNVEHGVMKGVSVDSYPIEGSFDIGAPFVRIIVCLAWLEIIHTLLGLSKGSPIASLTQVGFKTFVYFVFLESSNVPSTVKSSRVAGLLLFTWTLPDSIRYPFYIQSFLSVNIKPITWLRYSAWIILYPIGILSEAVVIYSNLDEIKRRDLYSYRLPNAFNISFDAVIAIYAYVFGFMFVASYFMLGYMWRQRTRVLSGSDVKKQR